MPEEAVPRREHEEFARRIDEENDRQNHRITKLEESYREIHAISVSVEKLATNMEAMLKEMDKQGKRLSALENRDGEKWRKAVGYAVTTVIGIVLGFVFTQLGM